MSTPTPFWDSNLLLVIATAVAGAVTYYIYAKQRIDRKKDAANIILLEIKRAEQKLKEAKQLILKDDKMPETIFAMKTANWSKYSYLFVRNFTAEEWNIIDEFYEKCSLYDEAVKYSNSFFRKNEEQIRINLQHALADYTQAYLTKLGRLKRKHKNDNEQLVTKTKVEYEKLQELLTSFSDNFVSYVFTPGTNY